MGVFENSVSGLLAFQKALSTTSHNISNVNTDGYSRQRAELGSRTPVGYGNGFVGSGVEVQTIKRLFDQTRESAVQTNIAEFERLQTLADSAGRIDDMVADESAGLSPAIQDFFGAVHDVANDPSSATARETMLTQARNLASRFRDMGAQLRGLNDDVNTQLRSKVDEVNSIASAIADLNQDIAKEQGRIGEPPNDLLDQRDALLRDLSKLIDTRTVANQDGTINVSVGTGQSLVSGFNHAELGIVRPDDDPTRLGVTITNRGGGATEISRQVDGGQIGGLLDFRETVLDPVRADLDRMATGVAQAFNAQHRDGLQFSAGPDDGRLGGNLFDIPAPDVQGDGVTVGNDFADYAYRGDAALSSVRLTYDAGADEWTAENLRNGDTNTFANSGQTVTFGGLDLDLGQLSGMSGGATVNVDPVTDTSTAMRVAIDRPSEIAVASPLRASEVTSPPNAGSGGLQDFRVTAIDTLPAAFDTATLSYDGSDYSLSGLPAGHSVEFFDADGNSLGNSVPYTDSPTDVTMKVTDGGGDHVFTAEATLTGTPAAGDAFEIARNNGASGDNGNALAMGQLTEAGVFDGGSETIQEYYSGLVGEVGTRTLQAQTARDAQESVLQQAKASRDEVSGVNLDEEAANLMRFQQAYQASAQAISIARTTFDSLLSATRG